MSSEIINKSLYKESEEKQLLHQFWTRIKECDDKNLRRFMTLITDDDLMVLIRTRKFNVERAFETLQEIVKCRCTRYPETFSKIYPSRYERILRKKGLGVLRGRDSHGRSTLYLRVCEWDTKMETLDDIAISAILLGYEMLRSKETQLKGINIIMDTKGFGFKHALHVTPSLIKRYVDIILQTSPVKIKSIHLTNTSRIFEITLNTVKMFLPQKIRKRLHMHSSYTSILESFPQDILPDWLGGLYDEMEVKDHELLNSLLSAEREEWFVQAFSLK